MRKGWGVQGVTFWPHPVSYPYPFPEVPADLLAVVGNVDL